MASSHGTDTIALVVRNSTVVIAAQVMIRVSAVGFVFYISRRLGSEGYGLYSLVTSFVAIFSFPADLGLSKYMAREVARNHDRDLSLVSNTAVLRLVIAPFVVLLASVSALVVGYQSQIVTGVLVASLGFLIMAVQDTLEALFIGHERLWFKAVTDLTNRIAFMGVALIALQWRSDFLVVITALLFGSTAALGLSVFLTFNRLGKIPIRITPKQWPAMLKASYPIAVLFISFSVALRFDTFVLNRYFGNTTVGWYSAAYDVMFGLLIVAQGINTAVFATASRLALQNPKQVVSLGQSAVKALLLFSLPCAVGGWLVADELVVFLFGANFAPAGPILRILLLTMPIRFFVDLSSNLAIAVDQCWPAAIVILSSSLLNIGLNMWLTPQFGTMSAALISMGCEALNMGLFIRLHSKLKLLDFIGHRKLGILLALSSIPLVVWATISFHLLLRICLGALVYGVVLLATGTLTFTEIKILFLPFFRSLARNQSGNTP